MWQLTMYCHLRPPDAMPLLTLKCFWESRETSDLMSMVSFTFTMRCHLIRLASAPFTSSRLAKFGWVTFAVCNAWQRSRTQNLRMVVEISGAILTRLWTKVHENFKWCKRPFVLSNAPARLSTSRFVQKIFASKYRSRRKINRTHVKVFWTSIFWGETTTTFLRQIISAIYCPPFGKVWLSSVSLSPSVKPSNELECRIWVGWVKINVLL